MTPFVNILPFLQTFAHHLIAQVSPRRSPRGSFRVGDGKFPRRPKAFEYAALQRLAHALQTAMAVRKARAVLRCRLSNLQERVTLQEQP